MIVITHNPSNRLKGPQDSVSSEQHMKVWRAYGAVKNVEDAHHCICSGCQILLPHNLDHFRKPPYSILPYIRDTIHGVIAPPRYFATVKNVLSTT